MSMLAGPRRDPSRPITAADVVDLVDSLQRAGIDVWLDGGWAVDAALERQTRSHDDLDLVVDLRSVELLQEVLRSNGYPIRKDCHAAADSSRA
jgi:lincosamide nucleotidyltransferase A/C/D/E